MMDGGSQAEIRAGKRCLFLCLRMVEEGGANMAMSYLPSGYVKIAIENGHL